MYSCFVDQVDQLTGRQWMGNLISIKQMLCTFSLVHIYHVFLLCWPVNQVNQSTRSTRLTGWQWMGNLISIKQELCTFSLVHIYHVFLLCQLVNQVDQVDQLTGWQWMGNLISIKQELLATDSIHTKEKQSLHTKTIYLSPLIRCTSCISASCSVTHLVNNINNIKVKCSICTLC